MSFKSIVHSIKNVGNHLMARITADLTSHRLVWNYIYMGLYVFIALWLTIFYAAICGNTVVTATATVVMGIFTNVVWSRAYEKKNKEPDNVIVPAADISNTNETGASD